MVITASNKLTCSLLLERWLVLFSLGTITTVTSSLSDQASSSSSLARAVSVCSKTVIFPSSEMTRASCYPMCH